MPLTRSEYGAYQKEANKQVDQAIQRLMQDPRWQALSVTNKEKTLQAAASDARESARAGILGQIGREEFLRREREAVKAQK